MGKLKETRFYTVQLMEMVDQGLVDKDYLINDLLGWLSEEEVERFMRSNDYLMEQGQ
jgi:hypothetical protein